MATVVYVGLRRLVKIPAAVTYGIRPTSNNCQKPWPTSATSSPAFMAERGQNGLAGGPAGFAWTTWLASCPGVSPQHVHAPWGASKGSHQPLPNLGFLRTAEEAEYSEVLCAKIADAGRSSCNCTRLATAGPNHQTSDHALRDPFLCHCLRS